MAIGREAEAAAVSRFLADLSSGPGVLLVTGEAGIGKTTLLRAPQSNIFGYTILSATPGESEICCEYAGLADLLEKVPAAAIAGLPPPQRDAIRQAVLRTQSRSRRPDSRTTATAVLTLLRWLARR